MSRIRPLKFAIDKKRLPSLFVLGDAADRQWSLLEKLNSEYHIFTFTESKKRNPGYDPIYSQGTLTFNFDTEDMLRQWLQRPQQESPLIQWQCHVDDISHRFPGVTQRLRNRIVSVEDKTHDQVLQALIAIDQYQKKPLTLRQFSARCFWGQSKFLERNGGAELLYELYPTLNIIPKPLLVNIYLPPQYVGVLFIENEDTYIQATQGVPTTVNNMALVYCAGYKASAFRIRQRDGVSMHYQGQGHLENGYCRQAFETWWFNENAVEPIIDLPAYFWGDLDYSGMDILKVIKQRFPNLQAWQPGYQPMLDSLINLGGHPMMSGEKGEQTDPGTTGCFFADTILLPAIRKYKKFVDQEYVF